MRELGLHALRPKRFRRTTQADPTKAPASNILARRFTWERPNQAWVGDVTYLWTAMGWTYVAILVDLCTRTIVGWAVSRHCDTDLTLRALDNAFASQGYPEGVLHHTDQGSTYTANRYQERLQEYGMTASMSRKGNCWDNAVAEATIGTIKAELFDGSIPNDIHAVQRALFNYIEAYYNQKRLHSAISYRTPAEYHLSFLS